MTTNKDSSPVVPSTSEISQLPSSVPERKSRRGCWIAAIAGCVIAILFGCGFFTLMVAVASVSTAGTPFHEKVIVKGSSKKLAIIPVEGIISQADTAGIFGSSGATVDNVSSQIDSALGGDNVVAILLRMNTPGGELLASDLIYRKVLEAKSSKTVVVWMGDQCASGGYYISAGADNIVAHPNTITGSIGVILQVSSLEELYRKIGIETRSFTSGEYKDPTEYLFDDDPDGELDRIFQSLVDEAYEDFVSVVADGRDMTPADVKKLADGRLFSGRQALDVGLVDSVGYLSDAIEVAESITGESDMTIVEYGSSSFWDGLYNLQNRMFEKFDLLPAKKNFGAKLYYLMILE